MRQVVNNRKEKKHQNIRHRDSGVEAPRPAKANQGQHTEPSAERNIKRISRLFLQIAVAKAPEPGPQINYSPQSLLHVEKPMRIDKRQPFVKLLRRVGDLAELLILPPFILVI